MKTIFECDYCESTFNDKDFCQRHEEICDSNPKTKCCPTCMHEMKIEKDDTQCYYGCTKKQFEQELSTRNMSRNCNEWELRFGLFFNDIRR